MEVRSQIQTNFTSRESGKGGFVASLSRSTRNPTTNPVKMSRKEKVTMDKVSFTQSDKLERKNSEAHRRST